MPAYATGLGLRSPGTTRRRMMRSAIWIVPECVRAILAGDKALDGRYKLTKPEDPAFLRAVPLEFKA